MKLQTSLLLFSCGIVSALAANACGSDDEAPPPSNTGGAPGAGGLVGGGAGGGPVGSGGIVASGGTAGSGGIIAAGGAATGGAAGNANACALDYATLPSNGPVSLKDDLMPIFGLHCAGDSCHSEPTKKAGLFLGPKCVFTEGAKWSCVFPAAPDPANPTAAQPITAQIIDQVHASLLEKANTVTGSTVKRVVPGEPAASFIIDKTSEKHNAKGYVCTNTDPKPGQAATCGDPMPPQSDPLCRSGRTGASKFTALAQWIKNGALKN